MQLFFSESSEFKKTKGLNLIEGKVKKIPLKENTIPHIGWSKIKKMKENNLFKNDNDFFISFILITVNLKIRIQY